jgi:hypothetical protein
MKSANEIVAALAKAFEQSEYETTYTTVAGLSALVAQRTDFRWRWVASRLDTFVVVFVVADLSQRKIEEMTDAAQDYATKTRNGRSLGMQAGVATIPVFISETEALSLRPWFAQEPRHRPASLRFPVLIEMDSFEITYFRERLFLGRVFSRHLHSVVEAIIIPTLHSCGLL